MGVTEEAWLIGQAGARQQFASERAGDVDGRQRHGPIENVDAQAPGLDPVADPHLGVGSATRRERQHEAGLRLAQDHAVVHDVATLVEQQRVARPPGLDVGHVAGIQPLQRLDHTRAGDDEPGVLRRPAGRPDAPPSTRPRRRVCHAATTAEAVHARAGGGCTSCKGSAERVDGRRRASAA
jgi:hypothetical protein